jgi:ferric-dicitrate binding protein FerR (iron transport regulator)
MRNRIFALGLALLFALAQAAPAAAGTPKPPADWSAVQALSPDERVAVSTKDGDRLKGRFDSASDTDINFTHEGRRVTLRRDSIKRVEVGHRNRLTGALVGAGIGGGAGTGAGFGLVGASDHFEMSTIPAGAFVGAGIGAAVGAAVGLGTKYETVYESL